MSRRFVHGASVLLAALASAVTSGCAEDKTETVDGGLGYAVEFPSKQAAIATESLKVYVYGSDQDCLALMQTRRSGGQLPAAVKETAAAPVCDYLSGAAGADIELDPGDYIIFAVGQRGNKDFLLGCARNSINATTIPDPVTLSLADETQGVPASTCNLLADKCGGGC